MPVDLLAHLIYNHTASASRSLPDKELRDAVDCYCWYTTFSSDKVLAALDGSPCIVLILSEEGIRFTGTKNTGIEQGFLLRGVLENTYLELVFKKTEFLIIKLHADGISYFNNFFAAKETIIPLPESFIVLLNQLKKIRIKKDRIPLLNSFLKRQLINSPAGNYLLKRAVSFIKERKGIISVNELCLLLKVNYKWLERSFRTSMNVSPKIYIANTKMLYAWTVLQKREETLTHIALEAGYYDQSHFIKAWKRYTGQLPSGK